MAGPPSRSPAAWWRPLVACLLVAAFLPLLSGAAKVVTHLPGFDGPLPFYLETGYVGLDDEAGTELFYYFVESERNPSKDPLVLWLTGGPGCSAFSGFVYEVGPLNYKVVPYNGSLPQLISNPYSWTKLASLLFLDTPVGSGFSYARDPKEIEERRRPLINLKACDSGYINGNPITGSNIDYNFRVPYAHGFGIISDQLYEAAMKNCKGDYMNPDNKICGQVLQTIHGLIDEVLIEDKCDRIVPKPTNGDSGSRILSEEHIQLRKPPPEPSIECFRYMYHLCYFWANYNGTRDALGIREGAKHVAVEYVRKQGFAMAQRWIDELPL
ncbi:hypothetical protein GUJ93_ZPchr0003g16661 [Zizania palustris]|uniref:Serine carboxypeptidase n=1 Tax=Zizania palustris TaxID=103762 RepID=A0A8J5RY08_ZIZPA|nr:hypothetical protein GUJ93_ZPchr0003g16661 [Zizania palustris]